MTKQQPEPQVVEPEPCFNCNGTGLVYGGFKYRKTCQVCQGTRVAIRE